MIDVDNDGVPDLNIVQPEIVDQNINGFPVAGSFDGNADNGDEVGIYNGQTWLLDTDGDYVVDTPIDFVDGNGDPVFGFPFVGDFDNDGIDDLGTWRDNVFQLDLTTVNGRDGVAETFFRFGFSGPRDLPVAADFDGDGIDDLGLWVPDRAGVPQSEAAEWYIFISDDEPIINSDRIDFGFISQDPVVDEILGFAPPPARFRPDPFGPDLFAQFGDEICRSACPATSIHRCERPKTTRSTSSPSTLWPIRWMSIPAMGWRRMLRGTLLCGRR